MWGMPASRAWRLSLSAQLWLLVAATALLCGALIGVGAHEDQARDRERAASDLKASADRTAAWLAPGVGAGNETEVTVAKIAAQPEVKALGRSCVQTLSGLQQAVDLGYLEVVSSDGRVLCTPKPEHRGDRPWAKAGPLLDAPEHDAATYPHGVNVEFVVRRGERHVAMRVHERGSGETRSCGTGACAVMVAAAVADGVSNPPAADVAYRVDVPGGTLTVTWTADDRVLLTGPAVIVASGTTSL